MSKERSVHQITNLVARSRALSSYLHLSQRLQGDVGYLARRDLYTCGALVKPTLGGGRKSATMGLEGEGEVVVVGMRMDAQSRELLSWALVNAARSKDRVFALHVLANAQNSVRSKSAAVALVKELDSLVSEYKGFCRLKQIDLQLKVCNGSSLRKVLVKETGGLGATKLVLRATKESSHPLRPSSTSVAKYCAKKLPSNCWVMAVNHGEIVFEKKPPSVIARVAKDQPFSMSCYLLNESNGNLFCLLPKDSFGYQKSKFEVKKSVSSCESKGASPARCEEDERLALVPVPESKPASVLACKFPDLQPGWPLLRKTFMERKKIASVETKIPVVQWAMQLPNRCQPTPAAVHSNQKLWKENSGYEFEQEVGSGAIVPTGLDAVSPHVVDGVEINGLRKELESLHERYGSTCRLFSYRELAAATSNFSPENFIGKGGCSRVYRGFLRDGRELAVKILKQTEEALREFVQEIEIITTLHHKNIVSLFGFCFERNNLMLVYDYFSRGSLEDNLRGAKGEKKVLNWAERYTIAVGVAEALVYLHDNRCDQLVIHRDVKSSNVLLSDDFEPQLTDFGLSVRVSASSPYITSSDVAGTFGYLAPEYFMSGKVTEKIDVYAFGIVLLELLSGRKPIDNDLPKGKESLVMWAKPILQSDEPKQLLDPKVGIRYKDDQVERMILAASLCIRRTPRTRPNISVILKLLEGDEVVTKWARTQANPCIDLDEMDEEAAVHASDFQSHLNLALLDVEDDALSSSSTEHCVEDIVAQGSLEAYLRGRWSRSSSFD